MANNENLMQYRGSTPEERRANASKAGKASGEARRRKANLRQTMNAILTSEVDIPEWTPVLEALGLDHTLETVISAAMVREAMNGNVKAYMAIKDVLGQTSKSETDLEEQEIRMEQLKADTERMRRDASPEMDDGVEVVNDAPEEAGEDIGDSDTKVPEDI